jgi:hypothetical protein
MKVRKKRIVNPGRNTSIAPPSAPVAYLSIEDADELLTDRGIPQADLPLYKNTVYASNASFWHHLFLLDRIDALMLREGRIYSKPRQRIKASA